MTSTSALPGTTVLNLPVASQLDGNEWIPMVQGGTTVRGQSGDVSNLLNASLNLVLTSTAPVGYPNARKLDGQTGVIAITDNGGGSNVAVSVQANGIGNTQLRQSAGISVVGNAFNGVGNVADITGAANQTLVVNNLGTSLGFSQLNLSSSNAVTGVLGAGFGGTGNSALSPYQVIAAGTTSSGAFQSVTAGTSGYVLTYVSSTSLPVWQSIPGFTQATAGNIANYTSSNSVGGNSYANISSATVTIGVASSLTGNLALASSIGGTTIITPSSASPTITLPQATTTLIGRDTVDTLTGKTFNTASSSNHLLINGTSVTAVTGGGNTVVLNSTPSISSAAIAGGQLSAISSFGLRTTAASFDLVLGSTETLTASRNLNIRVGDATRNLVLTGDLTLTASYALSYTLTNTSSLTLPTSGTLATIANTETLTNKTIATGNNTILVGATALSTISDLLNTLGSSQGQILYRSSLAWTALTIGSSTQVLLGGTIPQWGSLSGTGTVTAITGGTGIVTSPSTITSSGTISLATIASSTVLGNVSGATATPTAITGPQIATLLTAPTRQFFTSGAGTYTITSTAVKYIVVKMIGGGGGGAGSGTAPGAATNGSATTFGSSIFSASGGNAGSGGGGGAGGTASSSSPILAITGGTGGNGAAIASPNSGGGGGISYYGGAGLGGPSGGAGGAAAANSGSGGGGGGVNTAPSAGGGGGAGAYLEGFISAPSSTYSYSVGAGGNAGTAGSSGTAGGAGGSGQIAVYEYYQ